MIYSLMQRNLEEEIVDCIQSFQKIFWKRLAALALFLAVSIMKQNRTESSEDNNILILIFYFLFLLLKVY